MLLVDLSSTITAARSACLPKLYQRTYRSECTKTIKENLIFFNYYNNLQFVIPIILSINTIELYLYVHSCKIKLYIENTHTRTYDDN